MPPTNSKASASSGMGYERKKRNMTQIPLIPVATSSASNYRVGGSPTVYNATHPRSASPPASAYFPLLSADTDARFRPTADAESHFAYSTTLRRHPSEGAAALTSPAGFAAAVNAEAVGLWRRTINVITGQRNNDYQRVENGTAGVSTGDTKETASGKFAHCAVNVSLVQPTTPFSIELA